MLVDLTNLSILHFPKEVHWQDWEFAAWLGVAEEAWETTTTAEAACLVVVRRFGVQSLIVQRDASFLVNKGPNKLM